MTEKYDIAIIGGGPAGLAAAISAKKSGVDKIIVLERDKKTGGILNQCIHNGFGLSRFKESLTGPEYAARFASEVGSLGIEVATETTVLSLAEDKTLTVISPTHGLRKIEAKAIVLAMGCLERSRGALNVAGSRPAGIYSAGSAQKLVNIMGYLPGKEVVILGSGDIGLIMARRLTLEGAKVHAVCEIMPYSSGLKRNIVQCLDDFGIPLYLNHTITKIEGDKRVTGVVVSEVDENKKPIVGTEKHFDCDTVLFSVGLIPLNELTKTAGIELSPRTKGAVVTQTRETSLHGVFACGNVLQVHDLVDYVSEESELAGKYAAEYVLHGEREREEIAVEAGNNLSYVLPQKIDKKVEGNVKLFFRVTNTFRDVKIVVRSGERVIIERKKKIAVPGEMETLIIPRGEIEKLTEGISVSLEVEQ